MFRLKFCELFAYAEMDEDATDDMVLSQFLKLNFAGVPQSKEHIEYVKEISKNLKFAILFCVKIFVCNLKKYDINHF